MIARRLTLAGLSNFKYAIFDFSGIDNTICTHGGLLTYRNRQIVSIQSPDGEDTEPDSMPMIPLRILLINTNVPKNTKIQVENVKKIATSSPNVSKHIFEAMDEVAIECLDTLALLSTSRPVSEDSGMHIQNTKEKCNNTSQLYQKLEVIKMRRNPIIIKLIYKSHLGFLFIHLK